MPSIVICKRDISHDTVEIRFSESYIFVLDLKKKYATFKGFESHLEIGVRDPDSKAEYCDGDILLAGATVVVFRKMLDQPKRNNKLNSVSKLPSSDVAKTSATASLSDEARLQTLMDDLDKYFYSVDYTKLVKIQKDILRKEYVCNICTLPGHHVQNCPRLVKPQKTSCQPMIKKCIGIPTTELVQVSDITIPGVMQDNNGKLVITKAAYAAYENRTKNMPVPCTGQLKRKATFESHLIEIKKRKY